MTSGTLQSPPEIAGYRWHLQKATVERYIWHFYKVNLKMQRK
ncbi:hypothetical protein EPIR_2606 [Erwinia piriflorinigrans CFBP 5888]|uniref:Uncharacterized protein n=1 Tax=Erwinia piriflorinigrans CFBP 5888 TaxID=1161919 RepID=V5Z9R1_9GAMM|nr:hypothetical protein EPIR_2606 [Erwinia piriflorinigrans CFBP 5888]